MLIVLSWYSSSINQELTTSATNMDSGEWTQELWNSSASLHMKKLREACALTNAVSLHVAFARHAVPPQALMGKAAGETVLHPVVRSGWDHQQDVPHNGTK